VTNFIGMMKLDVKASRWNGCVANAAFQIIKTLF